MNKVILLHTISLIVLTIIAIPTAYANVSLSSDYYEMGDFLEINGYFTGYTTIDIIGDDFKKGYFVDDIVGLYEFGFPITKDVGYSPGIYNVTITDGDYVITQQFGLDTVLPIYTLDTVQTVYNSNDYAIFFGQVAGLKATTFSEGFSVDADRVKIRILDHNGDLVQDNWKPSHKTGKIKDSNYLTEDNLHITNMEFYSQINRGELYLKTIKSNQIDGHIPILDNGYKFNFRLDPVVFIPNRVYIVEVTYDIYDPIYKEFIVIADVYDEKAKYQKQVCEPEKRDLQVLLDNYNELVEQGAQGSTLLKIQNYIEVFKFSEGCN